MTATTSPPKHSPAAANEVAFRSGDWQKPLPKKTITALSRCDSEEIWSLWSSYLGRRKKTKGLEELFPYSQNPLLWSLNVTLEQEEIESFIRHLHVRSRSAKHAAATEGLLENWLDSPMETFHSSDALISVACAWTLADLSQTVSGTLWWRLKDRLISMAADALQLEATTQHLAANLLGGELPLVLAYFFPELKSTSDLSSLAIEFLSESLVEMLDGQGMLRASSIPLLGPLLGTWTRCRSIMEQEARLFWDDDAEQQYRWMVTQSLRMCRPHGGFMFASSDKARKDCDLLKAAIDLGGNKSDQLVAEAILRSDANRSDKPIRTETSYQSEWAGMGVMRSKWSKKSRQLAVTYDNTENLIELSKGRRVLIAGDLQVQLDLDGQATNGLGAHDWEQVAWESDDDCDYLEIERDVAIGTRLQRSFLLSRRDHFLLIADTILANENTPISHTLHLPLSDQVTVDSEQDTWEVSLKAPHMVSRLLPLGLPEWKTGTRTGSLTIQRRRLNLQQSGNSRLFVPLFIDLSPKRSKKKLTWRRLAVGEDRRNVAPDVAVGYRVQIGDEEWLIYRSLIEPTPRSLLGQNLLCEYHVSRFLPSGDVEPLIEVQQDHD